MPTAAPAALRLNVAGSFTAMKAARPAAASARPNRARRQLP